MKIQADKLGKKFNRDWIFRNLTTEFSPGIYAVTGPNGSGKSTLLQVLWGQMPATSGTVSYTNEKGEVPITEIYRHISIAAPYMDLIEEFTLLEMVRFHFKFKVARNGHSPTEVLELLQLEHAQNKPLAKFSSGMKQRTKLGLALWSQAEIVFLDEPGTNLDKPSHEWYWSQLNAIPPETIVIIASNQENEYPADCKKVCITDYKQVTKRD